MSKHTAGNWEAVNRVGAGWEVLADGHLIAAMAWWQFDSERMNDEISGANCRMMAASKDLLAACEAAVAFGSQGETHEGLSASEFLRAAIAKAKGESS